MKKFAVILLMGVLIGCGASDTRPSLKDAVSNTTIYQLRASPFYLHPDGTYYLQGAVFSSFVSEGDWYTIEDHTLCITNKGCFDDLRVSRSGAVYVGRQQLIQRDGDILGLSSINNHEAACNLARNASTAWSVLVGGVNATLGGAEQGARGYDAARQQALPRAANATC